MDADRGASRASDRGDASDAAKQLAATIHADLFTRPITASKEGTSGKKVGCQANFVKIECASGYKIHQYHVVFEPEVDSKQFRQQILTQDTVTAEIGKHFIFDGMIMYMTQAWNQEQILEAVHPTTQEPVAVKFKSSIDFTLKDPQAINCFNIIIRRCFDIIGYRQLSRNYFDPNAANKVGQYGLEVWPGYETAIRAYEEGLMLCIENRFKVLRFENLWQIINQMYTRCGSNAERMKAKIDEVYKGQTVVTHYNNKMYRVSRIDWDMTPNSTFTRSDGTEIAMKDYIKQQYNLEVTDMHQPLVIHEGKPKQPGEPPQLSFLIPEFCHPTGLTDEMRNDFKMMRALSTHTRLDPHKRMLSTQSLIQRIKSNENCLSLLGVWGVNLEDDLVELQARELPAEKLYGNRATPYVGSSAEWAREAKRNGNYRSENMGNWVLVCPRHEKFHESIKKFIAEMRSIGRNLAMEVGQPVIETVDQTGAPDYMAGVRAALLKAGAEQVKMVVILLVDDNKTRYDTLKKFLCTEAAVPSQCVLLPTLVGTDGKDNKNFGSIMLKIILQINCKMGGALWKITIPLRNAMIVGYDLYHDSTLQGKTIGACVSTYSDDFTKYYSQTRPHENPTELGNNLVHFIRKALRQYYLQNNNTLPDRLLLYRDGAGDGQIPYIRDHEVRLVREACQGIAKAAKIPDHEIKLSFTIVTKKVNMRVFAAKTVNGSFSLSNPNPGTVVDGVVTRPERMDFYMVPQFVNQGTVTPVCYNIVHDDTGLTADVHQRLAFKLCHMYYNWQGTVRVPAPCQYAHKLAFLVAQSTHKEAQEKLRDKLYFL